MNLDPLILRIRRECDALYLESCELRAEYERRASAELLERRKKNMTAQLATASALTLLERSV